MKMNLSRVVIRAVVRIRNAICNLISELMSILVQIAEEDQHNEVGGPEELDNVRNTSFDMASLVRLRKENSTDGFAPRKVRGASTGHKNRWFGEKWPKAILNG